MTAITATQPLGTPALADLQAHVRGRVLLPTSDGFTAAATPWNVAVPQRPAAVVEVADASDVVAVVNFCRVHGLKVTAQPGGHGATEALSGTVLLRTGALDEVWVDVLAAACAPEASGRGTLTFLGAGMPCSTTHDDATLARLLAVKSSVDPNRIIRSNHPLD